MKISICSLVQDIQSWLIKALPARGVSSSFNFQPNIQSNIPSITQFLSLTVPICLSCVSHRRLDSIVFSFMVGNLGRVKFIRMYGFGFNK